MRNPKEVVSVFIPTAELPRLVVAPKSTWPWPCVSGGTYERCPDKLFTTQEKVHKDLVRHKIEQRDFSCSVVKVGNRYWLYDGHHAYAAAVQAGVEPRCFMACAGRGDTLAPPRYRPLRGRSNPAVLASEDALQKFLTGGCWEFAWQLRKLLGRSAKFIFLYEPKRFEWFSFPGDIHHVLVEYKGAFYDAVNRYESASDILSWWEQRARDFKQTLNGPLALAPFDKNWLRDCEIERKPSLFWSAMRRAKQVADVAKGEANAA